MLDDLGELLSAGPACHASERITAGAAGHNTCHVKAELLNAWAGALREPGPDPRHAGLLTACGGDVA